MAKSKFDPSIQQAAFFGWITSGTGSCILEAVAGSGKTTTLIEALKLMSGSIFFGAYNKKIAEEIKARVEDLNPQLTISTMHAAGFAAWRKVARNVKVDDNKCRDLFRELITDPTESQLEAQVLALVSFAKQAGLGVVKSGKDDQSYRDLIEHFDLDCMEFEETVIALSKKLLGASIRKDVEVIDFDDMIYAPLVHKVRFKEFDWVLIDEAQDTNASRRALALSMLKRGGRLVAVGDRHQAIYGFTGADSDSLDLIQAAVSAAQMPLTVTYRCPKNVVNYARQWVSHIEAHESAPDGVVRTLDLSKESLVTTAVAGDAILCRFNAPLIETAYEFIGQGIGVRVEGREIGAGLKALVRRWKSKSFDALLTNLEKFENREVAKYRAKEQESRAVSVEDKVRCIRILISRVQATQPTVSDVVGAVCDQIDLIFKEQPGVPVVLLSTIHKSKGREWKKVIWLNHAETSKWARMEWEHQAEINLRYVAATRAKHELVLA